MIPVTVPLSKAELTIPTANLRNLPEGASFSDKQGHASVEVRVVEVPGEPEYIIVTATCDSLQVLCTEQERELVRIRSDTEKEKQEIRTDAAKSNKRWAIIGFICGACVVITVNRILKKIKKL